MTFALSSENLRRPWAVWWTLLVAVLFAFTPTLTHALAFFGASSFDRNEICSALGKQSIALKNTQSVDSHAGQDSTSTHNHCPFCLHTSDRPVPPPHHLAYLFIGSDGQQEMAVWQAFFYADNTRFWAAPRGPPVTANS